MTRHQTDGEDEEPHASTAEERQNRTMTEVAGRPIHVSNFMAQLAKNRPVFHSEADFQHAFAWAMREAYPRLQARLEIELTVREHLDLLLTDIDTHERTAVEFKYPRAAWSGDDRGEEFNLKSHGATDLIGYDTLKDVQRLESLVDAGTAQNGLLLLLTNEPAYWATPKSTMTSNFDAFRIHDGVTVSGTHDWGPRTGHGTKKSREKPIALRGTYHIRWHDYSDLGGSKGRFRWFDLEVRRPPNGD